MIEMHFQGRETFIYATFVVPLSDMDVGSTECLRVPAFGIVVEMPVAAAVCTRASRLGHLRTSVRLITGMTPYFF